MIINKIIRYFNGEINFQVSNGFCERLINLCAANNILIWNFEKTPDGFCAVVSAKDYNKVKKFAKKANVETKIRTKQGLMFKANKYKSRWGMIIGIVVSVAFLMGIQCFVWDIQVDGNSKVSTAVILAELKELGVHRFSFIPNIDFRMQKQKALLSMPQLSWLTINHSGCKLYVRVTEREFAPSIRETAPCDIVASKTGQIRYMEVYNGVKVIKENYTVSEGDKIISGKFVAKDGKTTYLHADAKVIAEVQFDKTLSIDIKQVSKKYTKKTKTHHYLTFSSSPSSFKLPLFIVTKIKGDYDITSQFHQMSLFGKKLPIGVYSKKYNFYIKNPEKLSLKKAREILDKCFLQYEATELKNCAIIERTVTQSINSSVLKVNIAYIVEENIAKKQEIKISG